MSIVAHGPLDFNFKTPFDFEMIMIFEDSTVILRIHTDCGLHDQSWHSVLYGG